MTDWRPGTDTIASNGELDGFEIILNVGRSGIESINSYRDSAVTVHRVSSSDVFIALPDGREIHVSGKDLNVELLRPA